MSLLSQMSRVAKNILKTLRNSWIIGSISFLSQPPSRKRESEEMSQKPLIIQSADIILSAPLILNLCSIPSQSQSKSNFWAFVLLLLVANVLFSTPSHPPSDFLNSKALCCTGNDLSVECLYFRKVPELCVFIPQFHPPATHLGHLWLSSRMCPSLGKPGFDRSILPYFCH